MKKFVSAICTVLILMVITGIVALAACDGKSRSYNVDCYKTFGTYQYAKATQSAACDGGHSVTLANELTVYYTDGTSHSYSGKSTIKKQVPAGKVGKKASGVFNATCSGGYKFPKRTATDKW